MSPRALPPLPCPVCHASFVPSRPSQRVCSPTCRQRKRRGTYVVTEADRAAMRRAAERVPVPLPLLTAEQVDAHVLATAIRNGEEA